MNKVYTPIELTTADVVFGGSAMKILPPMKDISSEFQSGRSPWNKWASQWFFGGLTRYPIARDGIDLKLAMRNLSCVMKSFGPKHEHKEAGVAFLASLWFTSPDGEAVKS